MVDIHIPLQSIDSVYTIMEQDSDTSARVYSLTKEMRALMDVSIGSRPVFGAYGGEFIFRTIQSGTTSSIEVSLAGHKFDRKSIAWPSYKHKPDIKSS